jgi:hypothetical protein
MKKFLNTNVFEKHLEILLISQLNPGLDATHATKFSGFLRKKWGCGGMRDTQKNPMVQHHFHD